MYDNVKHLGATLAQWRDDVFYGQYSLGELYHMAKDGVDFLKLAPDAISMLSCNNLCKVKGDEQWPHS